jgi:hypothetical protein
MDSFLQLIREMRNTSEGKREFDFSIVVYHSFYSKLKNRKSTD